MSYMAAMSRAIREELQQHGPTVGYIPLGVLTDYVDIVGAYYLDLKDEYDRRTKAEGRGATRPSIAETALSPAKGMEPSSE